MTRNQKLLAVAKQCKWVINSTDLAITITNPEHQAIARGLRNGRTEEQMLNDFVHNLPQYDKSVDLMLKAWATLTYNQQCLFSHELSRIIFGKSIADGKLMGEHDLSRLANASASERFEAFNLVITNPQW